MAKWWGDWGEWRRELAAAVVLGLFLGAIGPFGTYGNGGLAIRLAYWVGILVVGVLVFGVGVRVALVWGAKLGQPMWFTLPLAVILLCLPMSLITSTAVLMLWPQVRLHMRPFDWYAQAVVMGLPLTLVVVWSREVLRSHRASPAPLRSAGDGFLDRLPARLGRSLLCLQMEDHYVRAHTERGSDLILTPLKTAIAELGEVEGMQVHRSWWVARAAVVRTVQDGRNLRLHLSNGIEVPVSRAMVAILREQGWLGGAATP